MKICYVLLKILRGPFLSKFDTLVINFDEFRRMKKYLISLIFFFFLLENRLNAQSVADITQQITEGKTTDSTKAEAIYDWLTQNIRYDHKHRYRVEGDTTLRQEPYNVVFLKKAVCIGYAKTFKEMCRLVGIEAFVVEGFPKNANGTVERQGHAWNVVKLNNNWHLLDATWDAETGLFPKKYFLMDPSVFSQNHLPHDPMWQLLAQPIRLDCFANVSKCPTNSSAINFNYTDTIRLWQNLDSTQRLYNQYVRIQNSHPQDLWAMRGLGEYYNQQAFVALAEYTKIRQAITNKKRLPNDIETLSKLLDTTTQSLKAAQSQYEKLVPYAKKGEYTDAHLNLELIAEMLDNLSKEKEFIEQLFKK